jgi:hypothetical protein
MAHIVRGIDYGRLGASKEAAVGVVDDVGDL